MGRARNCCFRGLLCLEKPAPPPPAPANAKSPRKGWSFAKSRREEDNRSSGAAVADHWEGRGLLLTQAILEGDDDGGVDPNKHAIAVAAATAAVADAAVVAAQAAAAVVKLTSSGRSGTVTPAHVSAASAARKELAAVRIQAAFRAYLARRALRALKALVKLQALVRGHIIRQQTADMLRGIQALLRAQARARAGRAQHSESSFSSSKSSQLQCPDPTTPENFEQAIRVKSTKHDRASSTLKRSGSKPRTQVASNWPDKQMEETKERGTSVHIGAPEDSKSQRVLEMDKGKSQITPKRRSVFQSRCNALSSDQHSHSFTTSKDSTAQQTVLSSLSYEVQSKTPKELSHEAEEGSFCSANSSPHFFSVSSKAGSSRRGPFTPAMSDASRSILSGFSDYPNYMSCTESSRAKVVRSHSAPKQRPYYERSSSTKRALSYGLSESNPSAQRVSALHSSFTKKAYPGSGRLDRLGMPLAYDHGPLTNRF